MRNNVLWQKHRLPMEIFDHILIKIRYSAILVLCVNLMFSCENQVTQHSIVIENTIEPELLKTSIHSTLTEIDPQFILKRTEGFLFKENELSRIELKLVESQTITQDVIVSVYSFNEQQWSLNFTDILMDIVFLCDSIFDINGNGKLELVIQRIEGENGNLSSYFTEVYGMSDGEFSRLKTISKMENLSFQIQFQTVTTLNRDWYPSKLFFFFDESTTAFLLGKKYSINKRNELEHIETQILIALPNTTLTSTYKIENMKSTLVRKSFSNASLDSEYYGFLHWCDKK